MEILIVTGRLAALLLSCASASLPLHAGATSGTVGEDSTAVPAPQFAARSHWTFHVRHRHASKLDESDVEWQMFAKNRTGDWIFYRGKPVPSSETAGTIQTTTSITSPSWNGRNSTGTASDDLKEIPFSFPLSVGKTWDVVYDRAFGSVWAHLERHYRVVGWEDVTVPAGRFHALKVVMDGGNWRLPATPEGTAAQRPEAPPNVSLHHESWYVPTVQNQVRSVEVATAPGVPHPDEYELELTEFGLATPAR